jgi:hypothetical protein
MAQGNTWQVTSQATGQVTIGQAGQVVEGVIVYFVTADGNEGSVFVANNQYNPQTVRALVAEQATRMDEVGRLAGGNAGQG